MNNIFSLMDPQQFNDAAKKIEKKLLALSFDTTVIARSDSTISRNDQIAVCNDTYRDVVSNIRQTLQTIKDGYEKTDVAVTLDALKKDLDNNVVVKWNKLSNNADKYINQIFQDTCSERIFNYRASMEVLNLVGKLGTFLNGEGSTEDRAKFMVKLTQRCLEYSDDKLFDCNASKPMKDVGYMDITNAYEVINKYGALVTELNSESIKNTLNNYKKKVVELENNAATLDMMMENTIKDAKDIDDLTIGQYKQILAKAGALRSVHKSTLLMNGLLSTMQKTVHKLLDSALLSLAGDVLKNVTDPMHGSDLNPTLIETQAISNESFFAPVELQSGLFEVGQEGFFKRIMDRIKTYFADNDRSWIDTYQSIKEFMDFIEEHLDDRDVANYCAQNKWKMLPLDTLKKGTKDLLKAIKDQEKFVSKIESATTYEEAFKYPISKGLDIPEIMSLYNAAVKAGTNSLIYWRDKYTGEYRGGVAPNKCKDLIHDEAYNVYIFYKDEGWPLLEDYWDSYNRLTKINLVSGAKLGITNIASLRPWAEFGITEGEELNNIYDKYYYDAREVYNKNTSAFNDPDKRDTVMVAYYRTRIWAAYFSIVFDMLMWGTLAPYFIISDIKKYA